MTLCDALSQAGLVSYSPGVVFTPIGGEFSVWDRRAGTTTGRRLTVHELTRSDWQPLTDMTS